MKNEVLRYTEMYFSVSKHFFLFTSKKEEVNKNVENMQAKQEQS